MLEYYKTLIELRKDHNALAELNRKNVEVEVNEQQQTLILHRWYEDENIVCCMNFSKEQQQVKLLTDENEWVKLLDSADPKWKGPKASEDSISKGRAVTLQPESVLIYSNQKQGEVRS